MAEAALSPIRRQTTLTREVVDQLRSAILTGALAEGTALPESQTALKLGVSRVPVREALVELERQGLVEFDPNGRACVRAFTEDDIHEILELRSTLQVMAARLAAAKLSQEDLGRLEALLTRSRGTRDLAAFSSLDTAFHDEIVAIARHRRLSRVWGDLQAQMELWLQRLHRGRERKVHDVREATLAAHRKMIDVLATRKPAAAAALMERHCSSWSKHLPSSD